MPESLVLDAPSNVGPGDRPPLDFSRQYLTFIRLSNSETGHSIRSAFFGARTLVFISTPKQQRTVTSRQLMQMFDLTPAEARLAHGLLKGLSADEYGQQEGVSRATVRTQIRSILAETGTRRQSELMRLLSVFPSPPASE